MKFGVREICDVVLKAKATQKVGNKTFYKHEPVIYFDTLKTSTLEGAATTVYAQGGAGNPRLVAWEGERTITFTMEDALISPEGFMILSGAGLVEAGAGTPIYQHAVENSDSITNNGKGDTAATEVIVYVTEKPGHPANITDEDFIYVMIKEGDELTSEPFIGTSDGKAYFLKEGTMTEATVKADKFYESADDGAKEIKKDDIKYAVKVATGTIAGRSYTATDIALLAKANAVTVDYYVERVSNAKQIEITADKFGGNFYLEASTLFRTTDGVDMPAEFIIPNCKIQSNFTFTMASSGDPSTFTFTMDAFPDYTRFDSKKKVLSAIQIIEDATADDNNIRLATRA